MSKNNSWLDSIESSTFGVLDVSNSAMFAIFAKKKWFNGFNHNWLRFLLLPVVAIGFIINSIIGAIRYSKAANKNLNNLLGVVTQILGAIGASISIFGTLITDVLYQTPFAIGPYFFLGGVVLGLSFNLAQLIAKTVSLASMPKDSMERAVTKRAMVTHLYASLMLASIVVSVFSVLLMPVSPLIAAISSFTAAGFCLGNFVWNFIVPNSLKSNIEKVFGLQLPSEDMTIVRLSPATDLKIRSRLHNQQVQAEKSSRLTFFHRAYRKEVVALYLKEDKYMEVERYLNKELNDKLAGLHKVLVTTPNCQKHLDKVAVLEAIQQSLQQRKPLSGERVTKLLTDAKLARQSFLADVGDVEDLVQAYLVYAREVRANELQSSQKATSQLRGLG